MGVSTCLPGIYHINTHTVSTSAKLPKKPEAPTPTLAATKKEQARNKGRTRSEVTVTTTTNHQHTTWYYFWNCLPYRESPPSTPISYETNKQTDEIMDISEPPINESQDYALRFEDLTVDDDLPLLDRIVKYCRSGIALQRLVHVKMLAETAETVGYVLKRKIC